MKRIFLSIFIFSFFSNNNSLAQEYGRWYIDTTNQSGILARVKNKKASPREFMVAFEYSQKCEPIFSSIKMEKQSFEALVRVDRFPPQTAFLSINGKRHSWHGASAEYLGGREIGMGIPQAAWNALLSNPRTMSFIEPDGQAFYVPVGRHNKDSISDILQEAAQICLTQLR